ncbi:MAG: hypothetical protein ACJAVD_001005 [Porticoccaceae bacterium]|jgi:hypothetical protein
MKQISVYILLTIRCFSCSSSDDDTENLFANLASNGEDIILTLLNNALTYGTDASNANCLAYETTADDYINYSKNILD